MDIETRKTNYDWIDLTFTDGGTEVSVDIDKADAPEAVNSFLSALSDLYSLLDMDEPSIKQNMIEYGIIEPDGE